MPTEPAQPLSPALAGQSAAGPPPAGPPPAGPPPAGPPPAGPPPAGQTPLTALWRTRQYLRPHAWRLVLMLAAAIGAVGAQIAIPLLIKTVIDGPIAHRDVGALLPLGLAATGLGALEAGLSLYRRGGQAGAGAPMGRATRDQGYPPPHRPAGGVHDEWQSGR